MNTLYGCKKGCEILKCGKDCYATRSGHDSNCHCVCKYTTPCSWPCLEGDTNIYNDCEEMKAKNPYRTCTKYAKECCKTCEGYYTNHIFKLDALNCSVDQLENCAALFKENPDHTCSVKRMDCCLTCKGNPDNDRVCKKSCTNTVV